MLHTKHLGLPYCTGEVPQKKTHLNIRKVISSSLSNLIWSSECFMNPFGSISVAGELYAAVSLMSSPTISIGLLIVPDLGEADGCCNIPVVLRPMAAAWPIHGRVCAALGKSWAIMRPFSPPLPILVSAGAEHGRINDVLGEKKHKEAQTAHCAGTAAQTAKRCTCGAVLKPANCSLQLWPQLRINTFNLIWGFAPASAGNDSW